MADLKIGRMTLGVCATNCYFIYREGEKEVIFFDPADRGDYIYAKMQEMGFKIAGILITHGHFDHIWGADALRKLSGAKIYAWEEEQEVLSDSALNVSADAGRGCTLKPNGYYKDGDVITMAGMTCKLIGTPGHTKGGCCYYFEEAGFLISGDTLFESSVGRTDFPTGSMSTLKKSIKEKLFVLPDETKVYPGHGDVTTIGDEKKYNPFLA